MANLTPASQFDDVYQLETADRVLGGAGGVANTQAQALANRTQYLKDGKHIAAAANKAALADADKIALVDTEASNALKTTTWSNVKAKLWAAWGALINGGTAKNTPVDADEFGYKDSEATNATKKVSWANIKATLKAYFDTLYATITALTAAEVATGTDETKRLSAKILNDSLAQAGMWLAKRTKMPDGDESYTYKSDFSSTNDGWTYAASTPTVSGGILSNTWTTGQGALYKTLTSFPGGGKYLAVLVQSTSLTAIKIGWTVDGVVGYSAQTFTPSSTGYTVIYAPLPVGAITTIRIGQDSGATGTVLSVKYAYVGTISYLTGTLSEEAARIADQLGDSAGVGVAASGTITSNLTNVSNADTVTVAGKVYTFKTALTPTEGEVLIGGDYQASLVNLARAINHTGTPDTDYKCAAAHPLVSAANTSAAVTTITAITTGELGNSITLAKSAATLTCANAAGTTGSPINLSGGYSDAAAKIITAIGNNIAGGGTRPAAAKIDITSTSLIGYEQVVDVASGGTTTLPAGGTWVWFVYGYGATIFSAKRGSSAGGTTLPVVGAAATVWYCKFS